MGSANQVQIVVLKKPGQRLFPKDIRDPSVIAFPSINQWTWICPKQIANDPGIRNLDSPFNTLELLKRLQLWRDPTMHTEDPIADQCRQW
jgi:hypothetical protein